MNMNKSTILRIAVPTPLRRPFDYWAPAACDIAALQPGIRIKIPFRNRELIGILLEVVQTAQVSSARLKQVIELIDDSQVLSADMLKLCQWAADYYHYPIGEVIDSALPVLLRQGRPAVRSVDYCWRLTSDGKVVDSDSHGRARRQMELLQWLALYPEGVSAQQMKEQNFLGTLVKAVIEKGWVEKSCRDPDIDSGSRGQAAREAPLKLNAAQEIALTTILTTSNTFQVFLLDGVTGSGKTEVYLQVITEILKQEKQILILVPEIGLTPQTIERFQRRFAVPIVALHSGLSDKERLNAWLDAKSGLAKIVIGTRSAIFSPLANLGLIIIDEEHDISFKQQDGFRYHARDLAIVYAREKNIPIVLGSATPSLETLARAHQGRYQHLRLPERAGEALQPTFCVVDIRNQYLEEGLSPQLVQMMKEHLQNGDQVMLFLNRRGYAPVHMCHGCGWMATCKRCDARMTYHHEPRRLHCHHCDARKPVAFKCEKCDMQDLQIIGLGTERLEQALQKHFPDISIARIDRDSTQRKGSMENLLAGIQSGEHRILVGTQMLAKGHHFPNVTLVGIVDADGGFFSADFRAVERMGQLILQVAGRAGRDTKPGTVMIQTHHPDQPLLQQLIRESYHHFASALLQEREQALLPPYAFLALFRAEAHTLNHAMTFLQKIKDIAVTLEENIPLSGPVPAPMSRRAGRYRVQLLLQTKQRPLLQRYLSRLIAEIEKIPSKHHVRWSVDVDPVEMF
jgi:primosomal protein N' (replication factor Y)